jgi:hypothetical protein
MPSQPPPRDRPLTDFGLLPGERPAVPQAEVADSPDAWAEFQRYAQGGTPPPAAAAPGPAPVSEDAVLAVPSPAGTRAAEAPIPPKARPEWAYAPTEPAPLSPMAPPAVRASSPARTTLEQALVEARRFNRVCPRPEYWQRLYDMLPNKVTTGRHPHPAPPIHDTAWRATPALPKRLCLRDHLEWAENQGVLDEVMVFLKGLREEDWHHMGD